MAAAAHEAVDRIAERAGVAEQDLRLRTAAIAEQARQREQRVRAVAQEGVGAARDYLRGKPFLGMAAAFAAGAMIGALLLRRR